MAQQRIGLIADIHANLPALEAVLEHCAHQRVDQIFNLGDMVGYGPFPEQSVQRVIDLEDTTIIGNYDVKVLKVSKKWEKWVHSKNPLKLLAFQWAKAQLSDQSAEFLRSLPDQRRIRIQGLEILLTHGSPAHADESLTPETDESRFASLAGQAGSDVVLCGHSHVPFHLEVAGTHFVNPGSVGRPDDGNPCASYAVLIIEAQAISVQLHRIPYDIDRTLAAISQLKLPPSFADMFSQGRSLDWIQETRAPSNSAAPT